MGRKSGWRVDGEWMEQFNWRTKNDETTRESTNIKSGSLCKGGMGKLVWVNNPHSVPSIEYGWSRLYRVDSVEMIERMQWSGLLYLNRGGGGSID